MDTFESKYAQGEGQVFFRDKISVPKHLIAFVLLGGFAFSFGLIQVGIFPWYTIFLMTLAAGLFVFLGNVLLSGLRIVVSAGGIDVHVGIRKHHFDFADIVDTDISEYRIRDYPLGRGAVRTGLSGKAFMTDFSVTGAVRLHLKTGKNVLITTHKPEALRKAIIEASRAPSEDQDRTSEAAPNLAEEQEQEQARVESSM